MMVEIRTRGGKELIAGHHVKRAKFSNGFTEIMIGDDALYSFHDPLGNIYEEIKYSREKKIIPAQPGWYVAELLEPDEGSEAVILCEELIIAWSIDDIGNIEPITAGESTNLTTYAIKQPDGGFLFVEYVYKAESDLIAAFKRHLQEEKEREARLAHKTAEAPRP
jgi:hypothetical protein